MVSRRRGGEQPTPPLSSQTAGLFMLHGEAGEKGGAGRRRLGRVRARAGHAPEVGSETAAVRCWPSRCHCGFPAGAARAAYFRWYICCTSASSTDVCTALVSMMVLVRPAWLRMSPANVQL